MDREPAGMDRGMIMLLRKSWLQTRQRFLASLASIVVMLLATLTAAPWLIANIRRAHPLTPYEFPEYLWRHWFGSLFVLAWALCAILLGSGGLVWERSHGASVFTLSLPIRRRSAAAAYLAVAYGETFALAVVPTLIIGIWARAYPLPTAMLFSLATFACGSVFLAVSFGIAHAIEHGLTAASIAIAIAGLVWLVGKHPAFEWLNIFDMMTAEDELNRSFLVGNVRGLLLDSAVVLCISTAICGGLLALQRRIDG